ncbi:MAG: hypothetical protein ABGX60_02760, partial [Candidatus Thioglobus sp.]
ADTRDLNYSKYFEEGEEVVTQAAEYHSHNTQQLTADELHKLLLGLHEIQDDLKKFEINKGNLSDQSNDNCGNTPRNH